MPIIVPGFLVFGFSLACTSSLDSSDLESIFDIFAKLPALADCVTNEVWIMASRFRMNFASTSASSRSFQLKKLV